MACEYCESVEKGSKLVLKKVRCECLKDKAVKENTMIESAPKEKKPKRILKKKKPASPTVNRTDITYLLHRGFVSF